MSESDPFPDMDLGPPDDPVGSRKSEKIADFSTWSLLPAPRTPEQRGAWAAGDRVLAPWEPHWLYPGTVGEVRDGSSFVYFDDGGRGWVPAQLAEPLAPTASVTLPTAIPPALPIAATADMGPLPV